MSQNKGRNMKRILAAAIIALSFATANAQSASVEGNWGVQQQFNGLSFDITFTISKNSVTVTNVCSGFGTSAVAQVTSSSIYTDRTITVFEARQDRKTSGALNCEVATQPDTMNYVIQGNQLVLGRDGAPGSFVLVRK
jgi:hypothetical protein